MYHWLKTNRDWPSRHRNRLIHFRRLINVAIMDLLVLLMLQLNKVLLHVIKIIPIKIILTLIVLRGILTLIVLRGILSLIVGLSLNIPLKKILVLDRRILIYPLIKSLRGI